MRRLRARGTQPVRVSPGMPIADIVAALQAELREGPSGWLARALVPDSPQQADPFDAMEAEGWVE